MCILHHISLCTLHSGLHLAQNVFTLNQLGVTRHVLLVSALLLLPCMASSFHTPVSMLATNRTNR